MISLKITNIKPYYIKDTIIIHSDRQLTIGLCEDIQYADGKGRYINLIGKTPKSIFDKSLSLSDSLKLRKDGLINIDVAQISQHPAGSWFGDESNVVSKVE